MHEFSLSNKEKRDFLQEDYLAELKVRVYNLPILELLLLILQTSEKEGFLR